MRTAPTPKPRPRTIKCAHCGEVTPHIFRLCDDCLDKKVTAERLAQGLPAMVEDPEAYRLLARHIVANEREMADKGDSPTAKAAS